MFEREKMNRSEPMRLFLIMTAILLAICVVALVVVAVLGGDNDGGDVPAFDDEDGADLDSTDGDNRSYLFNETDATKMIADGELNAEYAMLCELDTLTIIASTGSNERIYPASMTKIMTMIVAIEAVSDLDAEFTFEQHVIDSLRAQGASMAGFEAGETVTVRDMLYGAALPSGGDATAGLAIYVSGSERLFAQKMNDKAASLGLENTNFVNASGLHHDNHYTTLSDMATMFAYALQNETFVQIMSAQRYSTGATNKHSNGITMYSSIFSRVNDVSLPQKVKVICGKTGYTEEAKHCLITLSVDQTTGKKYIFVTAKGSYTTFLPSGSTDGIYQPLYDLGKVYSKYIQ